jgi:hypothetical protein
MGSPPALATRATPSPDRDNRAINYRIIKPSRPVRSDMKIHAIAEIT